MNEDLRTYVSARTSEVLTANEEYQKLDNKMEEAYKNGDFTAFYDLNTKLRAMAEELCYLKGFHDAMVLPQGI